MRTILLAVLALVVCAATPPRLPRGDARFHLGMTRAQLDSIVAQRGLSVVSDGTAYLVCTSDVPSAEYEQYSFFQTPHSGDLLWRVTIGYRLDTTVADYGAVRGQLVQLLGEPDADSWDPRHAAPADEAHPAPTAERTVWVDPLTSVMAGARWSGAPDARADRMMVTWVDRRVQRLMDARSKKGRSGSTPTGSSD